MIGGEEKAAGDGAGPEAIGGFGACGFDGPDHEGCGGVFFVGLGIGGDGEFSPGFAEVGGTVELDAEMAQVKGGVNAVIALVVEDHGDRLSREGEIDNLPGFAGVGRGELEEAFACGDPECVRHGVILLKEPA